MKPIKDIQMENLEEAINERSGKMLKKMSSASEVIVFLL